VELPIPYLAKDLILPGCKLVHFKVYIDLNVIFAIDFVGGSLVLVPSEIFLPRLIAPLLLFTLLSRYVIIRAVGVA
jgi:hypothetical protein